MHNAREFWPYLDPRSCLSHSSTNAKKLGSRSGIAEWLVSSRRLIVAGYSRVWIRRHVGSFYGFMQTHAKLNWGLNINGDMYFPVSISNFFSFFPFFHFQLGAPLRGPWFHYNPMVQTFFFLPFLPFLPATDNRLPAPSKRVSVAVLLTPSTSAQVSPAHNILLPFLYSSPHTIGVCPFFLQSSLPTTQSIVAISALEMKRYSRATRRHNVGTTSQYLR